MATKASGPPEPMIRFKMSTEEVLNVVRNGLDFYIPSVLKKDPDGVPFIVDKRDSSYSYLWDPKPIRNTVNMKFAALKPVIMFFSCSYYGFFKPTSTEVEKQIPKKNS
ncbi:MAG: hypothetical protein KDH96_05945 [Candidatus Riesia sp.]|nr:hypothetical protein [Candidatus Riesia sp.]